MRRLTRGILLLLCWLPLQAAAVSLGDMVVRSVPGEPLRAHIPLSLHSGETLAQIRVALASAEEYQRRHLPRAELLQGVTMALLDRGAEKARIQIFGEQPWQGEEAQLLLLVSWPGGTVEQQFTLAAVTPAEEATPIYVEVAQDETLDTIAMRLSKGRNRSYLHMMYALFLANPDAFYRGNMNNLKSGQTLRVPSDDELYGLSDREVFGGIRQQYEAWLQTREAGQAESQTGRALAGMSGEQVSTLDLSLEPEALQQRLQQVVDEGEQIRQENEALRQRLQKLEQRMQSVAGQVLDYAADDATGDKQPDKPAEAAKPEAAAPDAQSVPEEESSGLSAGALVAAVILVLLFSFYIIYSTGHPHRGRS